MLLWSDERITFGKSEPVANPDGTTRKAVPVRYDHELVGWVARAETAADGWAYLTVADKGSYWTVGGGWDRRYAADQLLSRWSPSAAWLA